MRLRIAAATFIALAAASLSACSSDNAESKSAEFNTADVTFAQEMIPHHEQATEMAALAPSRTKDAAVLDLASRIKAAQDPEIDAMQGWLKEWGKDDAHASHADHMDGMDSMESMPGMMSDQALADLKTSTGAAFDEKFLTMMIEHHEGAVTMAKQEQADGKSTDAVALAKSIQGDQSLEISEMKKLLAGS